MFRHVHIHLMLPLNQGKRFLISVNLARHFTRTEVNHYSKENHQTPFARHLKPLVNVAVKTADKGEKPPLCASLSLHVTFEVARTIPTPTTTKSRLSNWEIKSSNTDEVPTRIDRTTQNQQKREKRDIQRTDRQTSIQKKTSRSSRQKKINFVSLLSNRL
ncbi:hypothetical protein J6590_044179 [Homalodisca vitripennis]|nr:hypothetical protein J6590_044179 [Homalodisca vitripennis]